MLDNLLTCAEALVVAAKDAATDAIIHGNTGIYITALEDAIKAYDKALVMYLEEED